MRFNFHIFHKITLKYFCNAPLEQLLMSKSITKIYIYFPEYSVAKLTQEHSTMLNTCMLPWHTHATISLMITYIAVVRVSAGSACFFCFRPVAVPCGDGAEHRIWSHGRSSSTGSSSRRHRPRWYRPPAPGTAETWTETHIEGISLAPRPVLVFSPPVGAGCSSGKQFQTVTWRGLAEQNPGTGAG